MVLLGEVYSPGMLLSAAVEKFIIKTRKQRRKSIEPHILEFLFDFDSLIYFCYRKYVVGFFGLGCLLYSNMRADSTFSLSQGISSIGSE